MSKLSTMPVIRCVWCGAPIVVTDLHTTQSDPDGELLHQMMISLSKHAMCDNCKARYNYLAKEGRSKEMLWER